MAIDITPIEDGQHFQLTLSATELSMFSLAITGLIALLKIGPGESIRDMRAGLMAMVLGGLEPPQIVAGLNSLIQKLDLLVDHLEKSK